MWTRGHPAPVNIQLSVFTLLCLNHLLPQLMISDPSESSSTVWSIIKVTNYKKFSNFRDECDSWTVITSIKEVLVSVSTITQTNT